MKSTTKSRLLLCVLLLLVMTLTFGFSVTFATAEEGTGESGTIAELSVKSVTSEDKTNAAEKEIAITVELNGPINKETVNHMARESEGTVVLINGQEKLDNIKANGLRDSVWNKLAVNGKTIREIMEKNKENPPADSDVAGSVDVHVKAGDDGNKIEIKLKTGFSGSVALDNGLTVAFLQGFKSDLVKVSEDITYAYTLSVDGSTGTWAEDSAAELSVKSVTSEDKSNAAEKEIAITVEFNGPINKETVNHMARENEGVVVGQNSQAKLDNIKTNGLRYSVWNKLAVNGKTIWEIMQKNKENPPEGGDVGGSVDVHVKGGADGNKMEIHLKTGFSGSVALEDGLTVTFLQGFRSDLAKVSKDVTFVYNPPVLDGQGGSWVKDTDTELEIESVTSAVDAGETGNINIRIIFKNDVNKETVNHAARKNENTVNITNGGSWDPLDNIKANGLRYSLWNKLEINGHTIKELIEMNEQNPIVYPDNHTDFDGELDVHVKNDNTDGKALFISFNKASAAASHVEVADGLKVTLLKGFRSDLAKVSESVSYEYKGGVWENAAAPIERKELGITSVTSNDDVANNEIVINVTFDKPINSDTVNHIARDSEGVATVAGNTQEKWDHAKANGLRNSVKNLIKVGDKTIQERIDLNKNTQGVEDYDGKLDVHVKAGADGNRMEIHIKKGVDGSVALEDGLKITFLAGFKSDLVIASADLEYSLIKGSWYKKGEEPPEQKEIGITSVTSEDKADEIAITLTFDNPINKETVNHMARDNEGTVSQVNGQAKLDHIKENGLRDSVWHKITVGGKTIKELIDLNKNTPDIEDYDGKLDVHVKGGSDGNKMEIHIKKGVGGSVAFADGLTVTFKSGFHSDLAKVSEDVTFVYNPPVLDGQGGTWVKDTDTELEIASVTSSVDASATGNICIQVKFKNEVNKETVNNAARETEATVNVTNGNSWAPLDNIKANGLRYSLWNKLVINGYTFKQLLQMNKADPPENGDYDGQLDIHVKNANDGSPDGNALFIYINKASAAASVVTYEDGLTVSLLKGFRSDLAKVSEGVSYEYKGGVWENAAAPIVREELGIESVTSEDKADEIAITVTFDRPINKETVNHMARDNEGTVSQVNGQAKLDNIKANGLRDSVWNKITIGGKTIRELIELNKAANVGDWDGALDVHVKAGNDGDKIEIHIKKDCAGSVALEEGLKVVFLSGFKSDLVVVSEDLSYSFIKGSWYKAGEEPPEQKEVGIVGISHKIGETDIEITVEFNGAINKERAVHMARDNEGTVAAVNSQAVLDHLKATGLRESVRTLVMVNGKTIEQMIDENEARKDTYENNDYDGRLDVHIEVKDEVAKIMRIVLKKADGFADFTKDVTVTVKGGFHSDLAIVSEDITYTYNAANKVWLAPGEVVPDFDEVKLVGVDAPDMKDSAANFNVEFVLRFDADIATRQHAYISMEPGFVSSFVGSKNDYSESEIVSFTKFGIFESMAKNILLNGKSVQDMMEESKWEFPQWPNVAVVHVAQGGAGNNTLRLVIGGQYVNGNETTHNPFQITDINQNFVITVKAGLRTPLGQEVKEDISFIYDPITKQWYEGDSVEDIPVNVTVTFKDGDTVLDTKTCLKGQTITAGIQRKEGYTFDGWFTDAGLTQAWDSSKAIEADLTVYAKFTKIADKDDKEEPTEKKGCGSEISGTIAGLIACLALGGLAAAIVFKKRRSDK